MEGKLITPPKQKTTDRAVLSEGGLMLRLPFEIEDYK